MTALEQMRARTHEIKQERSAEMKTLKAGREELTAQLEHLAAQLAAAGSAGNVKAYTRAAGEQRDAQAALDAMDARLRVLREDPAITDQEYRDLNAAVLAEYNANYCARAGRVKELLSELEQIRAAEGAEITETDKALLEWQREAYRCADMPERWQSTEAAPDVYRNKLKGRELYGCLGALLGHAATEAIKGEQLDD